MTIRPRLPHLPAQSNRRAGLAPVELVLILPLLMMVAALMMFVANATVWKLRSQGAAREAAFQQVHPRTGEPTMNPPEWRRPDVSTSVEPGPPVGANDPFQEQVLFRGPKWEGIPINTSLFEGSPGMLIGHSQSDIRSGIWTQMGVHYRFQRDVAIFGSQQWQYDSMGLKGHDHRRSLPLLNLE